MTSHPSLHETEGFPGLFSTKTRTNLGKLDGSSSGDESVLKVHAGW